MTARSDTRARRKARRNAVTKLLKRAGVSSRLELARRDGR